MGTVDDTDTAQIVDGGVGRGREPAERRSGRGRRSEKWDDPSGHDKGGAPSVANVIEAVWL